MQVSKVFDQRSFNAQCLGKLMLKLLLLAAVTLANPAIAARRDAPDVQLQKMLSGALRVNPSTASASRARTHLKS